MIGADEKTVDDRYGNVVFVTREPGAEERVGAYLERARQLGFDVTGNTIDAARSDIRAAMREAAWLHRGGA